MKMSGFCVYLSQTFSLLNKVQLVLEDGVIAVVRQKKDSGYKKIEIRPAQPTGKEVTKHMSLACPNAKLIYSFFYCSVVFAGFSSEALSSRINDGKLKICKFFFLSQVYHN